MNPELSLAATASLPRERANAKARRNVSSDVVTARTTSTSGISGTGLKKCRPTKRSARLVAAAMAALPDLLRHVAHDRLVARGRGDLRDAASHQTAPQHPHPSYLGHASPDSDWGWSTPGRRPGVEKRAPQFLGDPHEGARVGAREGMLGADFPALEPVEHLLEPHLNALVLRAVTPGHEQGCGTEQRRVAEENRGDDGERDRGGERRDRDRQGGERRGAAEPCLALVPDAGHELDVAEPRLELGHLSRHLGGARQRVALAARAQGPLNRGERAHLRLPGRAIRVAALQLEQLLLLHPPGERPLDGRPLARHDARPGEPGGSREPAPQAGLLRDIGAGALLEQGLVEVARRDADVLAQREDLRLGQPVADVLSARLELGGAADDALERLAADQLARHC